MRVQTIPMVLSNCPFIAAQNVRNKKIYDQLLNHNSLQIWHFQLHLPAFKKKSGSYVNVFLNKKMKKTGNNCLSNSTICVSPPFDRPSTHKLIAPLTAKLLGHCPLLIFYYCLYVTSTCNPDMSRTYKYTHSKIACKSVLEAPGFDKFASTEFHPQGKLKYKCSMTNCALSLCVN